jgi:prepilin-type N-terminal cleavage/methylation domain-containing protein
LLDPLQLRYRLQVASDMELYMFKRAFTLIELLVVIAIIAILAAILFPVFAQAKVAAKKASSLSNVKQQGTSVMIYTTDMDDTFPLGFGAATSGTTTTHYWSTWHQVPAGWVVGTSAFAKGIYEQSSLNSTQPYRKNWQMLELVGNSGSFTVWATGTSTPGLTPVKNGLAYNGLLHGWSATAVNAPSDLPMYTQIGGNLNGNGADTGPLPVIGCSTSAATCKYTPSSTPTGGTCGSGASGGWSYFFYPNASQWLYSKAQTWVFADTSAKARNLGMNINTAGTARTDFKRDPFTNYKANAVDSGVAWYDDGYCHALLYRPDFDFQTWPTSPIIAP